MADSNPGQRPRGCPVHEHDFKPDDCQWCADVLADRPISLAHTIAASATWTSPYEWDLLHALAAADACREPWAISHRRVFGGRGWMVQDLGRHGWLAASIPVASLHRAARALITEGLVKQTKISGGNYYALTEAGKIRAAQAASRA